MALNRMESHVKARRNEPCPCGSGKRYKACCGRLTATPHGESRQEPDRAEEGTVELGRLAALMEAGRYAELESGVLKLLGNQPESGFAWQLLAVSLSKQGKDALHALAAAAQRLPAEPLAHFNLGNALARLGRLDEARASYGQALAIRPDFAEAQQNLEKVLLDAGMKQANALRSIGRLDEAVTGYRRVLQLRPDLVAAHTELGSALRLQQRTTDCEASCLNALDLDPNSVAALAVLAELRADTGRFEDAEELYRRAISIDPESVEAWAGLARMRQMTVADGEWLAAAQRLAGRGLAPQRELRLRYAIGKYFDDVKDFENAFINYRRANELAKQCGPGHDRRQLTRSIDLIIRSHDQSWFSRERNAAGASARPVFIVGMLRSGTTLAEQILASHPAVFGAGELTFWGAKSAASITNAAALDAGEIAVSGAALAGLGDQYLELLQRLSPDALRVVNKFPTNFLFLGLIHAALPRARIIHMRRHPIDTCLSIYFQHFEAANTYANDLEDLAHYHREYQRLMRHWRAVLPADVMLDVPYEGMVLDLPAWSRRMLDFIALPWDERCLDFHRTARTVGTASRWQVRQKLTTSSVERWRNYERFVGPLKSLLESAPLIRP
jgi:tetratricopeptide (TPR) repeat protein